MGKATIVIKSYNFNRPKLLTIEEFNSYKQIYRVDPNFSLVPKSGFWKEFEVFKWSGIIFICGLPLIEISEVFSFIPMISFAVMVFNFLGEFYSMLNYSSMISKRRDLFLKLEEAIKNSDNYEEFKVNFKNVR
jgi:hypothetical protein